ncbi:MAG: TIGR00730 family Rossman fold protein [Chloroflexi bacterium]|nr:TIGR00730 family Rossman fold protein [Chloroflexota bacterium]
MRRVCVFAGARPGVRSVYLEIAQAFGHLLVRCGLGLVYGGSGRGLMGAVASAVRLGGGQVIGIMPECLREREAANPHTAELRIVGSLHERKAHMAELADAVVALPGGFGTLDELFEALTWVQLGRHATRRVGLLNVDGYFDPLLAFVRHAVAEGFVPSSDADLLIARPDPAALLAELVVDGLPTVASVSRS